MKTTKSYSNEIANAPLVWVVSTWTILSYHDTWKLFASQEEAKAYFDEYPLETKKMFQTRDIWGFIEKKGGVK